MNQIKYFQNIALDSTMWNMQRYFLKS